MQWSLIPAQPFGHARRHNPTGPQSLYPPFPSPSTLCARTRARTPTGGLEFLLRLLISVRNESVQETARLALRPAMLLRLGEFFLEMLLRFFVCFFVVMVVRYIERRGISNAKRGAGRGLIGGN